MRRLLSADVWLDERLVVKTSRIARRGLFFTTDIAADTVIVELGGKLVSSAELEALIAETDAAPRAPFVDTITVDEDQHLVLPPNQLIHFGNHSCDPTIWHVGPYSLTTRRVARAGEEATIDYATQSGAPGFHMICTCGATICRGVVTSDDWRDEQLRARYDGHWVPALQARISSM